MNAQVASLNPGVVVPPPVAAEHLNVFIAHDWLTGMRGGEKVLLELVRMFPQARIGTLFEKPGAVCQEISQRVSAVSALQRVPAIDRMYRGLLPIMPLAVKTISVPPCDLVISVSHCVAKGVRAPRGVPHICYCLTPMRYIWNMGAHYFQGGAGARAPVRGGAKSVMQLALRAASPALRAADLAQNKRVTAFLANSDNVAARIQKFYHRPATTVYSPIDEQYFALPEPECDAPDVVGDYTAEPFYLVVSALAPYKRVDIAVQAFIGAGAAGRKLIIIGKGPQDKQLRELAATAPIGTVRFLSWQDDAVVRWHYQHCRALIFPGEEDFGLVPLETQACGRPVIAYGAGGVLETVVPLAPDGSNASAATGVFFNEQTAESLLAALGRFERHEPGFRPAALSAHAQKFGGAEFRAGIWRAVESVLR